MEQFAAANGGFASWFQSGALRPAIAERGVGQPGSAFGFLRASTEFPVFAGGSGAFGAFDFAERDGSRIFHFLKCRRQLPIGDGTHGRAVSHQWLISVPAQSFGRLPGFAYCRRRGWPGCLCVGKSFAHIHGFPSRMLVQQCCATASASSSTMLRGPNFQISTRSSAMRYCASSSVQLSPGTGITPR